MSWLDWFALSTYFVLMLAVGFYVRRRVHNARDFFTAGGRMPWWLSGISHHMSGYSSAVFVGYAAIALESRTESYANVARITLDAITAYAADVRAARQIKGTSPR